MTAHIQTLNDGDTFIHDGLRFTISIFRESLSKSAPWEIEDCHGPVSEWTKHNKKPGEWLLCSDGYYNRYYNAAEATRIAKCEGLGIDDEFRAELAAKLGRTPTEGEIVAFAVRRDFEYLRGWANGEWHYVGVCVRHVSQSENDYTMWGIESNAGDYITAVAHELAAECAADMRAGIKAMPAKN